jgi:DNA-binding NarL/FixJ family response regulator
MLDEVRIAIIDDHPLFRNGVVQTLHGMDGVEVIAEGASAEEAIQIAKDRQPEVMLLGVRLQGGGIEATRAIAQTCPGTKIVLLTASENEGDVLAGIEAGAHGYVLKGISGPELVDMIVAVHHGETIITPGLAGRVLKHVIRKPTNVASPRSVSELTPREERILGHVGRGLTNKEVARALKLSEASIKRYMTNIMRKLQVRNRVEAALIVQHKTKS